MKSWPALGVAFALVCLVIPACISKSPSGPGWTQPQSDMGIKAGMTTAEVQAKLGKPDSVKDTFPPTDVTAPRGKCFHYDRRPQGVFLVYLDKDGVVTSTGWIER